MRNFLIPAILLGLLFACQPKQEFDYRGTYQEVISSEGEMVEWHGEPQNVEALDSLQIIESGNCKGPACGSALLLTNNSSRKVHVLVQAPFQIEDIQAHFATKYELEGQAQLAIGCSHLCRDEKEYSFERKIVGAEYVE